MKPDDKVLKRFWSKVKKTDGCWEWTGSINNKGYGNVRIYNKLWLPHRVSYIISCGEIPENMHVCHRCDNPKCVTPKHLFLGSAKQNAADKVTKNRQSKGVTHGGHKLSEKEVKEIRKLYLGGGESHRSLAAKYNVTYGLISYILHYKIWTHI